MKNSEMGRFRILLFMWMLQTESSSEFQKCYRRLTYIKGRSHEQRHDATKCASKFFAKNPVL